MDRQIVFPGSIPLDTDLLGVQRNTMVALGALAQATLGAGPVVDGLELTTTSPLGMQVVIGPGSVTAITVVDSFAFGSLPASADPLVKIGVNTEPTVFTLAAPNTPGTSVNYLLQASIGELDTTPIVLPYYNASNPSQPYAGPANSGVAQNTQRLQRAQLQLKPGIAALAGTQTTPLVDDGWAGLYVITVNYGQTAIGLDSVAYAPGMPALPFKLPTLTPGFARLLAYTTPGTTVWTVPSNVRLARFRAVGGGGGGGGGTAGYSGGGGGAGGYADGVFSILPGAAIPITVGVGGAGSAPGGQGGNGATSAAGSYVGATGGQGGGSLSPGSIGGQPGTGFGGTITIGGGCGGDGCAAGSLFAGQGGASALGGGGRGGGGGGVVALSPGGDGGGCYGSDGPGGAGGNGIVIVEY